MFLKNGNFSSELKLLGQYPLLEFKNQLMNHGVKEIFQKR